jgi:cell pole-organizing protein PopZ
MNTLRTEDDYKRAIKELTHQAEESLEQDLAERDGEHEAAMSDAQLTHYMQGLDLAITEEVTIALRAEFLRYSSVFDTNRSRDTIRRAVAEITKPLIEDWINRNMADIAREVITEAIGKISHVRPTSAMRRPK